MTIPKRTTLPETLVRTESTSPLPPADSIAIHELLSRVYLAEDSRDLDALRQLVTDDFVHVHSLFGTLNGVEAFVGWVNDNPQLFDGIRHQAVNAVTHSTDADSARAVSYLLVFQLFADSDTAHGLPRMIGHGVVRDSLVKQNGAWRLSHRIYDQVAVLPAFAPDANARQVAAKTVDDETAA